MIDDALKVAETALDIAKKLPGGVLQTLATSATTVIMALILYTGFHIVRENSFTKGIASAFLLSDAQRTGQAEQAHLTNLQYELRRAAASDKFVKQLMTATLAKVPGAARERLAVIHNGVVGLSGVGLLRWDITYAVAIPGRSPGEAVSNAPLSQWSEFLPTLLAGKCFVRHPETIQDAASRARWAAMAAVAGLECPIEDLDGRLLGATQISWENAKDLPAPADMPEIERTVIGYNAQIAAALDLNVPITDIDSNSTAPQAPTGKAPLRSSQPR